MSQPSKTALMKMRREELATMAQVDYALEVDERAIKAELVNAILAAATHPQDGTLVDDMDGEMVDDASPAVRAAPPAFVDHRAPASPAPRGDGGWPHNGQPLTRKVLDEIIAKDPETRLSVTLHSTAGSGGHPITIACNGDQVHVPMNVAVPLKAMHVGALLDAVQTVYGRDHGGELVSNDEVRFPCSVSGYASQSQIEQIRHGAAA